MKYQWISACVCIVALGVAACGDDESKTGMKDASVKGEDGDHAGHGNSETSDAGPEAGVCSSKDDGESCGGDKYCIAGKCVFKTCGDSIRTGDEECDDGNEATGDGCTPSCKIEKEGCGNANVEGEEECDDGNRLDDDGCTNECIKIECGNMRVDGDEECDDGNTVNDDDCSNMCREVRCRNGRVDPGEQCDDGNQIDNDGCNNKCKIMQCGNGKTEEKEECDDGNMVNDDACSNTCTANKCGNKRIDPGEQCDGELDCDSSCKKRTDDPCRKCEEMHCRDYQGIDLLAGCFEDKPPAEAVPKKPQPGEFSGPCKTLLQCSRVHMCSAMNVSLDPCYCGSAEPSMCTMMGPGPDSACKDEVFSATMTNQPDQVAVRLSDPAFPSAYAYYLVQCDQEFCKAECTPWIQ
jgi:cysteine-rich repeat protein